MPSQCPWASPKMYVGYGDAIQSNFFFCLFKIRYSAISTAQPPPETYFWNFFFLFRLSLKHTVSRYIQCENCCWKIVQHSSHIYIHSYILIRFYFLLTEYLINALAIYPFYTYTYCLYKIQKGSRARIKREQFYIVVVVECCAKYILQKVYVCAHKVIRYRNSSIY